MSGKRPDMVQPTTEFGRVELICYTPNETAESLRVSPRTLANWEEKHIAPPSLKISNKRLYPVDLLREWARRKAEQDETDDEK